MHSTAIKRVLKKYYDSYFYKCPYCAWQFNIQEPCLHFIRVDKKKRLVHLSLYENEANIKTIWSIEVKNKGYYREKD